MNIFSHAIAITLFIDVTIPLVKEHIFFFKHTLGSTSDCVILFLIRPTFNFVLSFVSPQSFLFYFTFMIYRNSYYSVVGKCFLNQEITNYLMYFFLRLILAKRGDVYKNVPTNIIWKLEHSEYLSEPNCNCGDKFIMLRITNRIF